MRRRLVCVWLMGGCIAEQAHEPNGPPGDPAAVDVPRIGANSLSPIALAGAGLITDALTATSAAAMAATDEARIVLGYAVGCALDVGQSVSFTVGDIEHTLSGAIGLAPGWSSGSLSALDAAWVSACLFAHANLSQTLVWISMRGDHGALATTGDELADYKLEEGAFWGNAFADLGPFSAHACNGVDQAADDSHGDLPLRQCAQWDGITNRTACGMDYAGLCNEACTAGSPYAGCPLEPGRPALAVITTMLYGTRVNFE